MREREREREGNEKTKGTESKSKWRTGEKKHMVKGEERRGESRAPNKSKEKKVNESTEKGD